MTTHTSPSTPKRHAFFISTPRNLEAMLTEELGELGIEDIKTRRLGVEAKLTQEEVYRVVYGSRIASRVLRPLASFACSSPEDLYEEANALNWSLIIRPEQTLKISAGVANSKITHSQYAALKLKDAVVDSLRDATGSRPSIDRENPDIRLDLHIHANQATISLFYSEGVMHRRGYRLEAVEATLKENLAAAVLRFSGWRGERPLYDFFCGSGTFLLEAAMLVTQTPAGFFRGNQGFEKLADFSPDLWTRVKSDMDARKAPLEKGLIFGYDISARAAEASKANVKSTDFGDAIFVKQRDFRKHIDDFSDALILSNPPYGIRLGDSPEAVVKLYGELGLFLKTRCRNSRAILMVPDEALEKELETTLDIPKEKQFILDNGAVEVRVNEYHIGPGRE